MCDHCGCSNHDAADKHAHPHAHPHSHSHGRRTLTSSQSLLSRNDELAAQNRDLFLKRHLAVINIVSSPGAGKTSLLERTLREFGPRHRTAVLVGDLATDNDARRLQQAGGQAVQITTGSACHLDAHMVAHGLEQLNLDGLELLIIENVGNLVCPASFDLGEDGRVVVLSTTEGEDKPQKYPAIFHSADLVVITKTDLSEAVEFKRALALGHIHDIAHHARVVELSSKSGAGMAGWYDYLESIIAAKRARA